MSTFFLIFLFIKQKMVDAAGVEPAVLCSGGFTVHWGYQFSYTSLCFMAEAQGFEPWEPFGSLVFKTSAIDHSAKLPIGASSRFRTADPRRVKALLYP